MPKVHPSHVVLAKHEPLGLLERIKIFNKFKEVGKPWRIPKPVHQSVISCPFYPELAQEAQDKIDHKGLFTGYVWGFLARKKIENKLKRV